MLLFIVIWWVSSTTIWKTAPTIFAKQKMAEAESKIQHFEARHSATRRLFFLLIKTDPCRTIKAS